MLVVALAFETLSDVCAHAEVLAVASVSHSGAMASVVADIDHSIRHRRRG